MATRNLVGFLGEGSQRTYSGRRVAGPGGLCRIQFSSPADFSSPAEDNDAYTMTRHRYGKRGHRILHAVRYVEPFLIYALTLLASTVSLLVYGTTLIRAGDGGLFVSWSPWFGVPYALSIGGLLVLTLTITGRWQCLILIAVGEAIHLLIQASPGNSGSFAWGAYLANSVTIACLLVSASILYQWGDEPVNE